MSLYACEEFPSSPGARKTTSSCTQIMPRLASSPKEHVFSILVVEYEVAAWLAQRKTFAIRKDVAFLLL